MEFTQTIKAFNDRKIPVDKGINKVRKTAVGLGSIALALVIAKWLPMLSVWLVYALIAYGGYCIAGDLVRGFADFLPATIKDIKAAFKG